MIWIFKRCVVILVTAKRNFQLNSKCAPRLSAEAAQKLSAHFVEMRAKVRTLDGEVKSNAKTAIPITVRYLQTNKTT